MTPAELLARYLRGTAQVPAPRHTFAFRDDPARAIPRLLPVTQED